MTLIILIIRWKIVNVAERCMRGSWICRGSRGAFGDKMRNFGEDRRGEVCLLARSALMSRSISSTAPRRAHRSSSFDAHRESGVHLCKGVQSPLLTHPWTESFMGPVSYRNNENGTRPRGEWRVQKRTGGG